jgi:hypothetical protein
VKTLTKWLIIGFCELIFCFWLLDTAANFVSAKSNTKVNLGVLFYFSALVVIPTVSFAYIIRQINDANYRKNELQQAFPDQKISLLQLLDKKR